MYLMNYHIYANRAMLPQIMAEDAGAAELRNPVFYIRTEYKIGAFGKMRILVAKRWKKFWSVPERKTVCACSFSQQ